MAKEKKELSLKRGERFTLPDSYFDDLPIREVLEFLNDGATYRFEVEDNRIFDTEPIDDTDAVDSERLGIVDDMYMDTPAPPDELRIVDIKEEIRMPSMRRNSVVNVGNSESNGMPYKTAIINGEKVVYAPISVMNGDINPFGMAPNITINPQNITINPQTVTMNPSVVTMNPDTVTMNPNMVTMNPETVTMNPNVVTMNAETVRMDTETVRMNTENVHMNTDTVKMNTESVQMNTDSVVVKGGEVSLESNSSAEIESSGLVELEQAEINADEQKERTLEERTGYKVRFEEKDVDEDTIGVATRVVGTIRKDGAVFFDQSSMDAALESGFFDDIEKGIGINAAKDEEAKSEKAEEQAVKSESKAEETTKSEKVERAYNNEAKTFTEHREPVETEVFDTEEYVEPVSVEPVIEYLDGSQKTKEAKKGKTEAKKSIFGRIWDKIVGVFGGKKEQPKYIGLPAGESSAPKKKTKSGAIQDIESLGSVYDFFNRNDR